MAESDEGFRSHRRDKFHYERGDLGPTREKEPRCRDYNKDRVRDRGREHDRKAHRHHEKSHCHREKGHRHRDRGRHERGQSYREKSERFSPPVYDSDFQPLPKHLRRDWDEAGGEPCQGMGDARAKQGGRGARHLHLWRCPEGPSMQQSHGNFIPARFCGPPSPPPPPGYPPSGLQSFKDFLLCLDPSVGEEEAVRCYTEYKMAFRRQQMEAFFLVHREEEWFRLRYHPEGRECCETKTRDALLKRLGVYMHLSGMGWFDDVCLDIHHALAILKVLDAVQILFEGGTENDLRTLEEEEEEGKKKERPPSRHDTLEGQSVHAVAEKVEDSAIPACSASEPTDTKGKAPDVSKPLSWKKKHVDEGEISKCNSVPHSFDQAERESDGKRGKESMSYREKKEKKNEEDEEEKRVGRKPVRSSSEEEEEEGETKDGEMEEVLKDNKMEEKKIREEREQAGDKPLPLPRHLHKTRSLFMRNIPPSVCKEEIVNLCEKYAGFRRVCLSEPLAEYRFFRRCWVTFDHLANIQDICWRLQNSRVREYKLSPVVHRDLCRRVRTANGITQHRTLLQDHIRLADKLIRSLDNKWALWGEDQEKGNPLLKNISYHLIEEVSAEEEELSRQMGGAIPQCEVTVEKDNNLTKVLDSLLLYLRVVHSVDFYSACHHASENDMPSCCGSIHVRGPVPINRVLTQHMLEWQRKFEDKLSSLSPRETLGEEEAERMGRKHPAQEVEKFIRANTREIHRDKWLCVLCEKKFKGPEFVQKHLLTRHSEQVEEVRKEAVFFNNFLMDPRRPALPEMRSPPSRPGQVAGGGRRGRGGGGGGPEYSPKCVWGFRQPSPSPSSSPSPPFIGCQGGAVPPNVQGGASGQWGWFRGAPQGNLQPSRLMPRESRKVIRYIDLDAPGEDFF